MSIFDEIRFVSNNETFYKMFIDGNWVESSNKQTFEVRNPHDNSLVGKVQKATQEDAEKAVQAAFNSKGKIASMSALDRGNLLLKIAELLEQNKDEIIKILIDESGKIGKDANGEIDASITRLRYAAEEAKQLGGELIKGDYAPHGKGQIGMVVRQPLGVILAVTPFNYPIFTAIAKIAPAIAGGNSLVVKPASDDPICLLLVTIVMQEAGIPPGVINVITGSGSEIGDYLASHEKIDMISFTGSTFVGRHMASVAGMKRLQLELGGKGAGIVLGDADLNLAVKECAKGALKFSGQRCDAISRVLIVNPVADNFVNMMVEEVKNWKLGDPKDPNTVIGPLINERAAQKVEELVNDAINKGAKILLGGKRNGLYFEPTVLDFVNKEMRIAWEETFGPVVTVIRVNDYEEAIRIANESNYGLDSCIFTNDIDKALDASQRIECGSVHINSHPTHGVGAFPFGGDKDSGLGREGIKYSIEEMTKTHTIVYHPREG